VELGSLISEQMQMFGEFKKMPKETQNNQEVDQKDLPAPQVYSVEDVCAILKISMPHFYQLKKRGVFKPIKLGRRTLIPMTQIEDLLSGKSVA
jgi:excisionase family DNA binding protein